MPKQSKSPAGLRYIGRGAFLVDIPARDLSLEELSERADVLGVSPATLCTQLVASGLYEVDSSAEPV